MNQQAALTPAPSQAPSPAKDVLQRQCACGQHTPGGGECDECRKKRTDLKRIPLPSHPSNPTERGGSIKPLAGTIAGSPIEHRFYRVSRWSPVPLSPDGKMQSGSTPNLPGKDFPSQVGQYADRMLRQVESPFTVSKNNPGALQSRLGPGTPLEAGVKARFESAFGTDFSSVRLHTDSVAANTSSELDAHAFTVGDHIVFNVGKYQPGTLLGDALIAHELVHVIQQRDSTSSEAAFQSETMQENIFEAEANNSALAAVASLWSQKKRILDGTEKKRAPRLKAGLSMQRCSRSNKTPDGVSTGPTDQTKVFCLKPGSFTETYSIDQNTASAASGRQDIHFEGLNTGQQDGKNCSCDCGLYRHWIGGYWRTGSATADKEHDISSCGHNLTISESDLTEEYTSCIGDNDPDNCKWSYADAPGFSSGLSEGSYVELQYNFGHEVWDRCQGKSVTTGRKTLTIRGDRSPRSITWS